MSLSASERYEEFVEDTRIEGTIEPEGVFNPRICCDAAPHPRNQACRNASDPVGTIAWSQKANPLRVAASLVLDLYDAGAILPTDTALVVEAMESLRRAFRS